ncbi:NADPH-dependent F420 reductase [Actinomadura parmotrematis]|uniref:NAD(P)-binding domain-containing protein n=1 Tax=Actinomadura parmotrematis TaxID=2864039 RepID=A0ABS7FWX6_9ACTN|nr:NAD(P)-binding domain-containing protein [Actinomadura parmotrematis]MBW8484675.1 NAD(P)-binding domain-containing protein [Actinomadura parmotrematis]
MRIGLLGTGNLAVMLGSAWAAAGHDLAVTGRDAGRAKAAAEAIGAAATPVEPGRLADGADAVVVAISWTGLADALRLVGGPDGALAGTTVIDATNPVDFATGRLLLETGSAAELVAGLAAGAHVVKALHLFAGASWPFAGEADAAPVVALCGDDAGALARTAELVGGLGARSAVLGGLDAARQAEEAAGFVMRVVAAGANPRRAVPDVDPALLRAAG